MRVSGSFPKLLSAAVLSTLVAPGLGAADERKDRPLIVTSSQALVVVSTPVPAELEPRIEAWKGAPSWQKLAFCRELLPLLREADPCRTRDYEWKAGTHDLRLAAGRAAWVLERMLDVTLPQVRPDSQAAELDVVAEAAAAAFADYRARAIAEAESASAKGGRTVEELTKTYRGRIQPDLRAQAGASSAMMARLLNEWFPIGRGIAELETIVGAAGKIDERGVTYRFDNGLSGSVFLFVVQDGVIEAVSVWTLE